MATRYFALIAGIVYALVGLMGLLGIGETEYVGDALTFSTGAGTLLGLFPVNLLHDLVHLGIGVWGIASYRSYGGAKTFARGLTILYAVLAVMGFIPVLRTTFGLIPIFGHDIWLHAGTAAIAAYFGWIVRDQPEYMAAGSR